MYSEKIFNNAPDDILFEIFRYLFPKDYGPLTQVNKQLNLTVRDNAFWKQRFSVHFPHHLDNFEITDTTDWYVEFMTAYQEDYKQLPEFLKEAFYIIKENVDDDFQKIQEDDFYRKDAKGISLYDWAYKNNNQKAFDYLYKLVERDFFHRDFGSSFLFKSGDCSSDEIKRYAKDNTLLHKAIFCYQSLDKIKEFGLQEINVVNVCGKSPLHLASVTGQVNLVMYLLENHAEVNNAYFDGAPLTGAIINGNMEIFEALSQKGADSNQKKEDFFGTTTLVDVAIQHGRLEIFEILSKKVNDLDGLMKNNGFDWLRSASRYGHSEIVEFLLQKGIHPNTVSPGCITPLQLACQFGHLKVIRVLLNYNVDINQLNDNQDLPTSLHTAIYYKKMAVLETLLSSNQCILNTKNNSGCTPLDLAEELADVKAIFLLKRQKLVHYIKQNEAEPDDNYYAAFSFFGQTMNVSYCMNRYSVLEKREAAKDLLAVLDGEKGVDLQQHKAVLTNGVLELVYNSLKEYLPDEQKENQSSLTYLRYPDV